MDFGSINIENIEAEWLIDNQLSLDVLRLDKLHPIVSGNKWFKLKYYLDDACDLQKSTIATFGGAWSNHIVATAFAARASRLKSIGIIRGERPAVLSYTLQKAIDYGMELHFVTRDQYRRKEEIIESFPDKNLYWIDEGGFGLTGAKGAAEILKIADTSAYTHIVAAVGTGTMLAGLISAGTKYQTIIGISSMKGNHSLEEKIRQLTEAATSETSFEINHSYHFGGYGKHPESLITFINEVYLTHHLPLDIVYTGKTFFAIKDLAGKSFFKQGSRLLMIHSGGLQGNMGLPAKVLAF